MYLSIQEFDNLQKRLTGRVAIADSADVIFWGLILISYFRIIPYAYGLPSDEYGKRIPAS